MAPLNPVRHISFGLFGPYGSDAAEPSEESPNQQEHLHAPIDAPVPKISSLWRAVDDPTTDPKAYYKAIKTDIKYLNATKGLFMAFVDKLIGVEITGIKSDFKSFDPATGIFTIQNANGDATLSFKLDSLKSLSFAGYSYFNIDDNGNLNATKVDATGKFTLSLNGNLSKGLFLTDGTVSIKEKDISIKVAGKNKLEILYSCKDAGLADCGLFGISVAEGEESFSLPNGRLIKGEAILRAKDVLLLDKKSTYQTNQGTLFETHEKDYIITDRKEDPNRPFVQGYVVDRPGEELIVEARYGNLGITANDNYKNIIVRQLIDREIDPASGTESPIIVSDNGSVFGHSGEPLEMSPNDPMQMYVLGLVKKMEERHLEINLLLTKDGGSSLNLTFREDETPVVSGLIGGLKGNIAHTFEKEGKDFPWLIYKGSPSVGIAADIDETAVEGMLRLWKNNDAEKLSLLLGSGISDKAGQDLLKALPGDLAFQKRLLDELGQNTAGKLRMARFAPKGDVENLQKMVIEETGTISRVDLCLSAAASGFIKEMIVRKPKTIEDLFVLKTFLKNLKAAGKPLQRSAIESINMDKGVFVDDNFKGVSVRQIMAFFEDDDEWLKKFLETTDFYPKEFGRIYFSDGFREKIEGMDLSFANRTSLALVVERFSERMNGPITDTMIADVTDVILEHRKIFEETPLFDKETYLIPVSHDETPLRFDPRKMIAIAKSFGVKMVAADDMVGQEYKNVFLDYVKNSAGRGKTVVWFNNHGGPRHQSLSARMFSFERSYNLHREDAVSYLELGNAVIAREKRARELGMKTDKLIVIIDSCYAYDFTRNLGNYLQEEGIDKDMLTELPIVITVANRGQQGWSTVLNNSLKGTVKAEDDGKPLFGSRLKEVETSMFMQQDMAVFMPFEGSAREKLKIKGYEFNDETSVKIENEDYLDIRQYPPSMIEVE